MRILLAILFLSFTITANSFGQGVIFHEDFESSTIPDGWSTANVGGGTGTWDWSFGTSHYSWQDTPDYDFDNNAAIFDDVWNNDYENYDQRILKHDPIDISIFETRSIEFEFSLQVYTSSDSYGKLMVVFYDQNAHGYITFKEYESNMSTQTVEFNLESFLATHSGIDQENFIFGFIYDDEDHELGFTGGAGIGDVKIYGTITNDESCDYRELESGDWYNASTAGAKISNLPTCSDFPDNSGGWFQYTNTNNTKQLVELITIDDNDLINFQVFEGFCDDLECVRYININRNAEEFFEAEPYVDYYIFAYCNPDIVYKLGIWEFQNPPNDEWADATEVTVILDNVNCTNPTTAFLAGATSSYNFWEFGGTNDGDIWYKFVAPSTGAVKMLFPDVSVWERVHIDLYDTPSMFGAIETVEVSVTSSSNSHKFGNLTPGSTYYLRLYSTETNTGNLNFCIQSLAPPSNDLCANAIEITCGDVLEGTNIDATSSGASDCGVESADEGVWYHFAPNNGGGITAFWTTADFDTKLTIYEGNCNSLSCITYNDDFDDRVSDQPYIEIETLPETDYYLYVMGYGTNAGSFALNVACTTPINDEATGAIDITVNPSGSACTSPTLMYNNNGVSDSSPINGTPACGSYLGGDLWYKFEAPSSGSLKIIRPNRGNWGIIGFAIYSSTESTKPMRCGIVDESALFVESDPITGLSPGNDYWLRIWEYNNNDFGSVGICLQEYDVTFEITPLSRNLSGNAGSTIFTVNTTVGWSVTETATWLTATKTSGTIITVLFSENYTGLERTASINATATGSITETITITQTSLLADDLAITNTTYSNGEDDCLNANYTITVAGNGTTVDFENGSSINLIAGESITFLPGFHAYEGSYVDAHITTNSTFCDDLPINILLAEPIAEKSLEGIIQPEEDQTLLQPSIKVYPNPNKGCFKIELEGIDEAAQIMIFNSNGAFVHQLNTFDKITTIDLSNKQRGIYLLRVNINGKHFTQKVIIQ